MSKCIHLVEDDEDIRFIIEYLLTEEGYKVDAFPSATAFYNRSPKNIADLVILDVMLPDGNGIEICRNLKAEQKTTHIPVIIMSAHAAEKSILEEACANSFISKPFDLNFFTEKVKLQIG